MKDRTVGKSRWRFAFAGLVACGGIGLAGHFLQKLLFFAVGWTWHLSDAASIGIIGGADGPTAIYVTGVPGIHWGVWALCLAVGIWGCFRFSKSGKKK